jgi:hypothetical protein
LGGYWRAVEVPGVGLTLRLSHDQLGEHLFPTPEEAATRRADLAERELRELRAELLRRAT